MTMLIILRPPPLYKLNYLREDGKDGMKLYTDPNHFLYLWQVLLINSRDLMG